MATIFRKIGGRIVPITVTRSIVDMIHGGKDIDFKLKEGVKRIGEVWASQSSDRPHRFFVGSQLNQEYRGAGLGKEFYGKLAATIRKLGGKTMVGTTDNVATIRKVRESVGKTKGFVGKGSYSGTMHVTLIPKRKK